MQDKAYSKRQMRRSGKYSEYKGRAPFLSDRFIEWLVKMIVQIIVFSALHAVLYNNLSIQYQNDLIGLFVADVTGIIYLLIISDTIAHVGGYIAKHIYLRIQRYVSNRKKNNNLGKWLWEYIIYTIIRTIFYMVQLVNLLSNFLQPFLSVLSTFTAWIILSIMAILIARGLSIYIISK